MQGHKKHFPSVPGAWAQEGEEEDVGVPVGIVGDRGQGPSP